jgi:hypothetical protein
MAIEMGYALKEITPPLGVELAGYGYFLGRCATAVEDPLFARAWAIRQDEETYILIDCDLLGLGNWMVQSVRGALNEWYGIAEKNVMMVSIHTHTGPTTGGLPGCGELDPAYAATLPGLLVQAAVAALEDLLPVERVEMGESEIDPIGYNRAGFEELDKKVHAAVYHISGKAPIALVSHACHPVTYGRSTRISADYPGAVTRILANAGYRGMFMNGVCGDVDPVINKTAWGTGTPSTMMEYGQRIFDGFKKALQPVPAEMKVKASLVGVDMPLAPGGESEITEVVDQITRETKEVYAGSGYVVAANNWRKRLLDKIALGENKVESIQVQILMVGEMILVGLPYEAFTALGMEIASCAPDHLVVVLGNANATTAYMPTAQALKQGFSYATIGSCIAYGRFPFDPIAPEVLVRKTCGEVLQGQNGRHGL